MSYSGFFIEQIALFKKQYPRSDGWQIYEHGRTELSLLPEFLEKHPEAVKSCDMVRAISHASSYRESREAAVFEVKKRGWLGHYELVWKGEQVNIASIPREERYACNHFLVAAKSFESVRRLYLDILKFEQKRMKAKASKGILNTVGPAIHLTNGSWDNIILPNAMADDLKAGVETFFRSKKEYKRFNIPYKRGFIFSGPAGCGKTLTAKAIISTMRLPAYLITPSPNPERTSNCIEIAFDAAASHAPSIILIEELEKLSDRAHISMILNLMDGLSTIRGVLVIATTNYPEKIDPALLLRPSRFDRVWQFPLPDAEARLRFLKKKAVGQFPDELLVEAARRTGGFSMAYVQEIFASALSLAMRDGRQITSADMLKSVEILKKQIKSAPASPEGVGAAAHPLGFAQV